MTILNRLEKLESQGIGRSPCFCNKALIDVFYGPVGLTSFAACPKCPDRAVLWQKLAADATETEKQGEVNNNEH